MELDTLSQAMYHARELAMTRMEAGARRPWCGTGIVGGSPRDRVQGVRATTSPSSSRSAPPVKVRRQGQLRNDENKPFTSDPLGSRTSGP